MLGEWADIGIATGIAAFASLAYQIIHLFIKTYHKGRQKTKEDIAIKIQTISTSLKRSANELADLQEELKERIAFVEKLNEQAKKSEDIASLNKEQVAAINDILSSNLKKEGRKSFWQGVLVNFVFFVLGAVASYYMSIYFT